MDINVQIILLFALVGLFLFMVKLNVYKKKKMIKSLYF